MKLRIANLEMRKQESELKYTKNLWEALDILGTRTRAQRELEKQNAINKAKFQVEEIERQEQMIANELVLLEAQRASASAQGLDTSGFDSAIATLKTRIAELRQSGEEAKFTLEELMRPGFNESEWQAMIGAMKNMAGQLTGIYQGILDERYRIAQEERQLLDQRISELQRDLDLELRLNEQGFASEVQAMLKAIEQEKAARDKALQEEKRQAQERRRLEQIIQTINLLTSVSNILKTQSKLGPIGIATAAVSIAGLFSLWGSSKGKARTQMYEKGGHFLLQGKSHAQGGVPLAPGHEAQGGEMVSIFSRSATRKYAPEIKSMTDMFNNGFYRNPDTSSNIDLTDVKAIRKLMEEKESITYQGNYKIIKRGNTTTVCRLN
jgi:hypothetical protein